MKNGITEQQMAEMKAMGVKFYDSPEEQELAYLKDALKRTDEERFVFLMNLMKLQRLMKQENLIQWIYTMRRSLIFGKLLMNRTSDTFWLEESPLTCKVISDTPEMLIFTLMTLCKTGNGSGKPTRHTAILTLQVLKPYNLFRVGSNSF